MLEPPADIHVYLDSNVVRDFWEGLNEEWSPDDDMTHPSNRQRIDAVRLVFYGYRGRTPPGSPAPWYLVVSTTVRMELERRTASPDLVSALFAEVNLAADAPSNEALGDASRRLGQLAGITDPEDATHLAHAALRPWVKYLVTSDRQFARRAARLDLHQLQVISLAEAVKLLNISAGERPPMGPCPEWVIPA